MFKNDLAILYFNAQLCRQDALTNRPLLVCFTQALEKNSFGFNVTVFSRISCFDWEREKNTFLQNVCSFKENLTRFKLKKNIILYSTIWIFLYLCNNISNNTSNNISNSIRDHDTVHLKLAVQNTKRENICKECFSFFRS